MKVRITLIIIFIGLFYVPGHTQETAHDNLITTVALMKTVTELSSPLFQGRLPGQPAYNKAAAFMAREFELTGLEPLPNGSFYQHLEVETNNILPPCAFHIILSDQTVINPVLGKDFTFRGFTGAGNFKAPVVFAGFGISSDAYNDYKDINVKGKVAIVFRTNPVWQLDGQAWPAAAPRQKAAMARKHGAVGILLVSPPGDRETVPEVVGSVMHGAGTQQTEFPQIVISRELANLMLKESGMTLNGLYKEISHNHKPASRKLKIQVRIQASTEYHENAKTMNVVGLLSGNDPLMKNEYLVIGAHLDHVGQQCGEIYFPGANDNASGCAAVLEIAMAFQTSGFRPARSVLFVLFASEEQGLQGAEYFVKNSPVPKDKIVAMLNFDCIAYGDSIQLGNGHSAPALWKLARTLDSENLVVKPTWSGGGADATPFYEAGIPALYFVSTNSYGHLHSITDTPETLNQSLFTSIVHLGLHTARKIASGNYNGEIKH